MRKHLIGRHNQQTHGRKGTSSPSSKTTDRFATSLAQVEATAKELYTDEVKKFRQMSHDESYALIMKKDGEYERLRDLSQGYFASAPAVSGLNSNQVKLVLARLLPPALSKKELDRPPTNENYKDWLFQKRQVTVHNITAQCARRVADAIDEIEAVHPFVGGFFIEGVNAEWQKSGERGGQWRSESLTMSIPSRLGKFTLDENAKNTIKHEYGHFLDSDVLGRPNFVIRELKERDGIVHKIRTYEGSGRLSIRTAVEELGFSKTPQSGWEEYSDKPMGWYRDTSKRLWEDYKDASPMEMFAETYLSYINSFGPNRRSEPGMLPTTVYSPEEIAWFDRHVRPGLANISMQTKHLAGRHNQKNHGHPGDRAEIITQPKIENIASPYTAILSGAGAGLLSRPNYLPTSIETDGVIAEVVAGICERTDVPKDVAHQFIYTWENSANDPESLFLKKCVSEEFGIESNLPSETHAFPRKSAIFGERLSRVLGVSTWNLKDTDYESEQAAAVDNKITEWGHQFVRDVYNQTQKFLKDQGVTEVILYRGMDVDIRSEPIFSTLSNNGEAQIKINDSTLSSWTSELSVTNGFGNIVLASSVPAEEIFSTARTGIGCFREAEFVLLGKKRPCTAALRSSLQEKLNSPIELAPIETQDGYEMKVMEFADVSERAKGKIDDYGLESTDNGAYFALDAPRPYPLSILPKGYFRAWVNNYPVLGVWAKDRKCFPTYSILAESGWVQKMVKPSMKHLAGKHQQQSHGRPGPTTTLPKLTNEVPQYTYLMSAAGADIEARPDSNFPTSIEEKQLKKNLVHKISERTGVPEYAVNSFVAAWSACADNATSNLLKHAVIEELEVTPNKWDIASMKRTNITSASSGIMDQLVRERRGDRIDIGGSFAGQKPVTWQELEDKGLQRMAHNYSHLVVKDIYAQTQKFLADNGVTELIVYRGIHKDFETTAAGITSTDLDDNVLSSWSTEPGTAFGFGTAVLVAKVPAKDVFSLPRIGIGCLSEAEVVLKGAVRPCRLYDRQKVDLNNQPRLTKEKVTLADGNNYNVYELPDLPEEIKPRVLYNGFLSGDVSGATQLGTNRESLPKGYFFYIEPQSYNLAIARWSKTKKNIPTYSNGLRNTGWGAGTYLEQIERRLTEV